MLHCGVCEHVFAEEDAGPPVYECSRCGGQQVGEHEDAGRCESCNVFCAKVGDRSCPECEAPDDEIREATAEQVKRAEENEAEEEKRRAEAAQRKAEGIEDPVLVRVRRENDERIAHIENDWVVDGLIEAFRGIPGRRETMDLAEEFRYTFVENRSQGTMLDEPELAAMARRILGREDAPS